MAIVLAVIATMVLSMAALLAVAGPFGTYERGSFGSRFLYWSVTCGLGCAIAVLSKRVVSEKLPHLGFVQAELIVIVAMTLLFSPVLQQWTLAAFPGSIQSPPTFWAFAGSVFVVTFALSGLVNGVRFFMGVTENEDVTSPPVRLVKRLPAGFNGTILGLSAENHLVVVMTTAGMFRLRMRLSDAIEEVEGLPGFPVHRSHWVTREAMTALQRNGSRVMLRLRNGADVPVSRTYLPALEALGLPEDLGIGT